jgi:hypothetical protein
MVIGIPGVVEIIRNLEQLSRALAISARSRSVAEHEGFSRTWRAVIAEHFSAPFGILPGAA